MSNVSISIEIKAPELAEAIISLASALAIGKGSQNPELNRPVEPLVTTTAQLAPPVTTTAPIQTTIPGIAPAPAAAPPAPPATPAAAPPASAVPTTTQEYTLDQLAVAATQLVDAGRRTDLVNLLTAFGVQALTALPKEQYGNFATQLRTMGAKI